jgi:hypothetical protein
MKFTAYIWDHQLARIPRDGLSVEALAPLLSIRPLDASDYRSQIVIGEVEIDLTLLPEHTIVNNAVIALRKQAQEIRAEAGQRARVFEEKAEQLLAIENKPTITKESS